jgi:hypothetical protein
MNCFCIPVFSVADVGEILMETGIATVTKLDADFDGSAMELAETVTWAGLGRVAGAV